MSPRTFSFLILLAVVCSGHGQTLSTNASQISGVVLDENGKPLRGAVVYYHNVRPMAAVLGRFSTVPIGTTVNGSAATASDGTFLLSNLTPDTYYLCASGVSVSEIPTCSWSGGEVAVAAGTGQNVPSVVLSLTAGAILTFNVSDVSHQIVDLSQVATPSSVIPLSGGNFEIGVFSGQAFQKAKLISTAASGRTYQLTVPTGTPFSLYLGTSLKVVDANGNPEPTGQLGPPIALAAGSANATINLTVQ